MRSNRKGLCLNAVAIQNLYFFDFINFQFTFVMQRFNYRKTEYEIESANRFNDFLNTLAKQLLDEASEILFKPLQKMDDDHIFGDIQIVKHTGYKVDMLKELKKGDGVKIDEHDIPFGEPH